MKNSKKGFTLVELVVVIAILAILAAIAIPVVSNTINSSKISGALSDAQTLELAVKEADAQVEAGDDSVYKDGLATSISSVYRHKGVDIKPTVTVKGSAYQLVWDFTNEKFVYVFGNAATKTESSKSGTAATGSTIDGQSFNSVVTSAVGQGSNTAVASLFK